MDRFAVVRGTRERDFAIGEPKPFGSAGNQQRYRLKRLCGRTKKRDRFGRTEESNDVSVRLDRDDVPAVARLGKSTSSDFDERFGNWNSLGLGARGLFSRHLRES